MDRSGHGHTAMGGVGRGNAKHDGPSPRVGGRRHDDDDNVRRQRRDGDRKKPPRRDHSGQRRNDDKPKRDHSGERRKGEGGQGGFGGRGENMDQRRKFSGGERGGPRQQNYDSPGQKEVPQEEMKRVQYAAVPGCTIAQHVKDHICNEGCHAGKFGAEPGGGFGNDGRSFGPSDGRFGQRRGDRPRTKGCYNCGEEGHRARDCPKGGGEKMSHTGAPYQERQVEHQDLVHRQSHFGHVRDWPKVGGEKNPYQFAPNQGHSVEHQDAVNRHSHFGHVRDWPKVGEEHKPHPSAPYQGRYAERQEEMRHIAYAAAVVPLVKEHVFNEGYQTGGFGMESGGGFGSDTRRFGPSDGRFGQRHGHGERGGDRPRIRGCYNCGEEGHRARDCPKGGGIEEPKPYAVAPNQGHYVERQETVNRQSPFEQRPIRQTENTVWSDMSNAENAERPWKPRNCYNCGADDHLRRDCPKSEQVELAQPNQYGHNAFGQVQTGIYGQQFGADASPFHKIDISPMAFGSGTGHGVTTAPAPKTCHYCRQEGHFIADCPKRPKTSSYSHAAQQGFGNTGDVLGSDLLPRPLDDPQVSDNRKVAFDDEKLTLAKREPKKRTDEKRWKDDARRGDGKHSEWSTQADQTTATDVQDQIGDAGFAASEDLATISLATIADTAPETKRVNNVKHDILLVDQLMKTEELRCLLLKADDDYTRDDHCTKCRPFEKCSCMKKVVVFVHGPSTAETVKMRLAVVNIPALVIHGETSLADRKKALARFAHGLDHVLILAETEAAGLVKYFDDVAWIVNTRVPATIQEYNARVEMGDREGKELLVTSFYDTLMDASMAKNLIEVVKAAGQEAPTWLEEEAVTDRSSMSDDSEEEEIGNE